MARNVPHMSTQTFAGDVPEGTVVERLWIARTRKGLEKQELAALIEVSRETVGNYEDFAYTRKRTKNTMRRWARACGVNEAWLLTGQAGPDTGPGLTLLPHVDSNHEPFD